MASTSVARKYTNISFEDIRAHLVEIVKAKEGALADMGDSSFGKTMIELFAGFGDLTANWVEAAFGNAFLESATAKPAVYAGARYLGYSVRRPVPAKCSIGIRVAEIREHGTLKVFIPKGTVFTMSGATLTSMDDMEFTYDYDADPEQTGLMELSRGINVLAEGQFRTEVLVSNGRQNQEFHINDASFSDYFGENDPNFSDDGNMAHRPACFTRIASDATLMDNIDPDIVIDDKLYWRVSRRGLEDPGLDTDSDGDALFSTEQGNYSTNYTALVATANDGSVVIRFGNGIKSAIPFGNIEVTYFSTNGEAGNMLGVFGTALSTTGGNITITTKDGQETEVGLNELNICLVTDIRGGLDIESIESIRNNASAIYNTLDRLVNRESYKVFLRRYADVKYASAYGEDVLNTKLLSGGMNIKYMNQIRFTVLKDLYRKKDGKYYPTNEDEYMLSGYKVNGLMYNWLYDFQDPENGIVNDGAAIIDGIRGELDSAVEKALGDAGIPVPSDEQVSTIASDIMKVVNKYVPGVALSNKVFSAFLTPMDFVVEGSELHSIMLALNRRGMLTVGDGFHNYVYPSVHNMEIKMDVVLFKGNNFTDIRERIKNVVYRYLKDNTEFGTPIFRSKIASLVHSMKEVAGIDVYFRPADSAFADLDIGNYPWMGDSTSVFCNPGTTAFTGMTFALQGSYRGGPRITDVFAMAEQSGIQNNIAEYYRVYVKPHVGIRTKDGCGKLTVENTITDKLIDRFVAYIWQCVMDEVYKPIKEALDNEYRSGGTDVVRFRSILESVKTWDMGKDSLKFKNTSSVTDLAEVNGVALFDYMRYGMDYIKLVRRILGAKSAETLINGDTGNITEYTNDNEIVQFTIPNELINLSVAQSSSLLTGMGGNV